MFQQITSTFQYRVQLSSEIKCYQLTLLSRVVIENQGVPKTINTQRREFLESKTKL